MNDERKCHYCKRIKSQHPGMTFASDDARCRCSYCLTGHTTQAAVEAVNAPARVDPVSQRVIKTPRPSKLAGKP